MTQVMLDAESYAFPRELLAVCESALLLFCSGRMGAADGHWVREAGLVDVTCVDWDAETLDPFSDEYPAAWEYVHEDAWRFAGELAGRRWDFVSADMPSQYAGQLREALPLFCALATKYATVTLANVGPGAVVIPDAPDGWRYVGDPIWRNEYHGRRFWWLVLERDT